MRIAKKAKIAENLKVKFSKSEAVVLTDYKGLDVESINLLRKELRKAEMDFQVVKNSLLKIASGNTYIKLIKDDFVGPSAVALCYRDPVLLAKILVDFSSKNKNFEIKRGVLEGKVLDKNKIKALAFLPSRDVLLSQLVMTIGAVRYSLHAVISAVLRNFLNVLQEINVNKTKK